MTTDTSELSYQASSCNEPTRKLSPDDILDFIGFGRFQVVALLLAGFTFFVYACDVSTFIFVGPKFQETWNLTQLEYAILPAVVNFPNLIGSVIVSFISDRYGRVWPYALDLTWVSVFATASAFAPSYPVFIVLRGLNSIGIGGIIVLTFPTFVEYMPVRNRAKVTVLVALVAALGLCVCCGLAWWLIPTYPRHGWRYFVLAVAIPALPVALFRVLFHFESPRFLVAKQNVEKAWIVFSRMAWINGKDLSLFLSKEEAMACLCLAEGQQNHSTSILQLLQIFKRTFLRTTICLIILISAITFGYRGATLFLPEFLMEFRQTNLYLTILVVFAAQILGILLMSIIIEWPCMGRLNSLRLFAALSSLFFLLLTFIQTQVSIPIFLVLIYFSMVPIPTLLYTYISETYPTNIRALTTAFFYSLQSLCGCILPFVSAYTVESNESHWLYPAFWAVIFRVQVVFALILNYEPYAKKLTD